MELDGAVGIGKSYTLNRICHEKQNCHKFSEDSYLHDQGITQDLYLLYRGIATKELGLKCELKFLLLRLPVLFIYRFLTHEQDRYTEITLLEYFPKMFFRMVDAFSLREFLSDCNICKILAYFMSEIQILEERRSRLFIFDRGLLDVMCFITLKISQETAFGDYFNKYSNIFLNCLFLCLKCLCPNGYRELSSQSSPLEEIFVSLLFSYVEITDAFFVACAERDLDLCAKRIQTRGRKCEINEDSGAPLSSVLDLNMDLEKIYDRIFPSRTNLQEENLENFFENSKKINLIDALKHVYIEFLGSLEERCELISPGRFKGDDVNVLKNVLEMCNVKLVDISFQ